MRSIWRFRQTSVLTAQNLCAKWCPMDGNGHQETPGTGRLFHQEFRSDANCNDNPNESTLLFLDQESRLGATFSRRHIESKHGIFFVGCSGFTVSYHGLSVLSIRPVSKARLCFLGSVRVSLTIPCTATIFPFQVYERHTDRFLFTKLRPCSN